MPSRRRFLRAGGTVGLAGLTGLAGCSGADAPTTTLGSTSTETRAPTPTRTRTRTDTPAETETETFPDDTDEASHRVGTDRIAWESAVAYGGLAPPTLAGDRLLAGDADGTVTAVSPDDGAVEWTFDAGGGRAIRPTPLVVGGRIVVVSGGHREHRAVHGLDPATGEERWRLAPRERRLTVLGTGDGAVFVTTAAEPVGTAGEALYALALDDGTIRWTVEVGDATDGLVADGTVYVPSKGTVTAVGVDGERKWRYEGADYQSGTLAVAGDTVAFVTAAERRAPTVRGLDAATGEERWSFDDWRAFTTRAVDGRLLVGGERLARLDPTCGDPAWVVDREVGRLVTGNGENRWIDDWRTGLSGVPADQGALYTGGESVSAVDVADGTVRWTTDLDAAFAAPAGLNEGRLVVHASASVDDRDRHVHALDAAGGEQWTFAGRDRLTEPVVGNERVYVTGARTGLLALEL